MSTQDELLFQPPLPADKIEAMTYADCLRAVLDRPLNDPLFHKESGIRFHAVMKEKRHALPDDMRASIHHTFGLC